jgi:transposase-like protein
MSDGFDPYLPPNKPRQWTTRRKAAVVLAVRQRTISVSEAFERYDLSPGELAEWARDLDRFGVPGLRTTRISIYRKTLNPE